MAEVGISAFTLTTSLISAREDVQSVPGPRPSARPERVAIALSDSPMRVESNELTRSRGGEGKVGQMVLWGA